MPNDVFHVMCPSCETSYEVLSPDLVGEIIACPKCGGMIKIEAPDASADVEFSEREENDATIVQNVVSDVESFARDDVGDTTNDDNVEYCEKTKYSDSDVCSPVYEEIEKRRVSRALAATLGVFCAVVVAFTVTFAVKYRDNSQPAEKRLVPNVASEATEPIESESTPESVPAEIDAQSDELAAPVESEDVSGSETELALAQGSLNDAVETPNDVEIDASVDENETIAARDEEEIAPDADGEEGASDGAFAADETAPTELAEADARASDEDPLGGSDEGIDLGVDELGIAAEGVEGEGETPTEDEEGDDAMPGEFNEEKFAKENNAVESEEGVDVDEIDSDASAVDVAAQFVAPTLKAPGKEIVVEERLKLPIKAIVFPDRPAAALRLLSEFSGVPVEIDLDRYVALRPSFARRIDLKLEAVDVATAFDRLAETLKWKTTPMKDRIVVDPQDPEIDALVEEKFPVDDLLDSDAFIRVSFENQDQDVPKTSGKTTRESLLEILNALLATERDETSERNDAYLKFDGDVLCAKESEDARRRVEIYLEQMRATKGLEQRTKLNEELIAPEYLGWIVASAKTPLTLIKPVSLQSAIEILESKFKTRVLWDDAVLNEIGASRDSSVSAKIETTSFDRILFDLLEPLNLTYVILDEKLFLITSKEKAAEYKTVELHRFADSDRPTTLAESIALAREMTNAVAKGSWREEDVSLWADGESNWWIVRQAQPIQREVRRWLDDNRLTKKSSVKTKNETSVPSEILSSADSNDASSDDSGEEATDSADGKTDDPLDFE